MVETPVTVFWLYSCKCVVDGRVRIDTRSAYPSAFIHMKAARIETRQDFISFVIDNLN